MSKKLTLIAIAAACALCLGLVACGGSSSSSSTPSSSASSSSESSSSAPAQADNHNSYFVGKWYLYDTEENTPEQAAQVRELYANDADYRAKLNEQVGRTDEITFAAIFEPDGTGTIDTIGEVVPFTWEATNEGAVTFTSFNGKDTKYHAPITDGKFTLSNGDTYAKAK